MNTHRPSRGRAICTLCRGSGCVLDHMTFDVLPCPACTEPPASWRELAGFFTCVIGAIVLVALLLAIAAYGVAQGALG